MLAVIILQRRNLIAPPLTDEQRQRARRLLGTRT
jgi:hypothetical protein